MKNQLEDLVLRMYKDGIRYSEAVSEFQKSFILRVLQERKGNQLRAARDLGMHRNTLRRIIHSLQIDLQAMRASRRRPPQSEHSVAVKKNERAT
jgi:Fis family transcriptional regulator, factor for inversion stimulation protein